jgi:hypothetical protein
MFRAGTLAGALLLFASPLPATDLYVATTGTDQGDCSNPAEPCLTVAYAMREVSMWGGDTIHVAPGDYPESLMPGKSVIIEGAGATSTSFDEVDVQAHIEVAITGVTHWSVVNEGTLYLRECLGRGRFYNYGSITLVDCEFRGDWQGPAYCDGEFTAINTRFSNIECGCGGGGSQVWIDSVWEDNGHGVSIGDGGVFYASGSAFRGSQMEYGLSVSNGATATLDNCTISSNTQTGVSVSDARLSMSNTTVSSNSVRYGAVSVGAWFGEAEVYIDSCTISGNMSSPGDQAAAVRITGGAVTVTNSTISGNAMSEGCGGIVVEGGTLHLDGATVTGNQGLTEGGLCVTGGEVTLSNTIIGLNVPKDGIGPITSEGHNLITDTSGFTISGDTATNLTGVDPLLGPLADNGGPTLTHALLVGSPAIDAGDPAGCGSPVDQRGACRHTDGLCDGSARCDMGAYELEGCLATLNVLEASLADMSDATAIDTTQTSPYAFDPPDGGLLYYQVDDGHGFPAVIRLVGDDGGLEIHF